MAICIEPMVNMKSSQIRMAKDGWTALAVDGLPSALRTHLARRRRETRDPDHSRGLWEAEEFFTSKLAEVA